MFTYERAVFGFVVLVLAVDDFVHATLQDTVDVLGQQWVPETAPDDFGHVPLSTAEHAFEFLDDLAVAANRAVEALQVAVDDEDQVVQLLAASQGDGAQGFRLVTLAVAQEAPDFLLAFRDEATRFQVLHEACLVDRLDRAQAHGYSRELPEVRHQPRVRVGRQALTVDFLAEVVHLFFADAAFHERTGVDAWRGVTLEVDQVAAVFVGRGLEEVVEADVIQGCAGCEAGDVTAQVRIFQVRAHYHRHGVPTYQRANAAFHEQVARHACFVGNGDGVAVWRGDGVGQLRTAAGCEFTHTGHQVVSTVFAFFVENRFQGVQPFLGFDGIEVLHGLLQGGKATRIGCLKFATGLVGRRHKFLDGRRLLRRPVVLLQIVGHFSLSNVYTSSKTTQDRAYGSVWLVSIIVIVDLLRTRKGESLMLAAKMKLISAISNLCSTVLHRAWFLRSQQVANYTPIKDRP